MEGNPHHCALGAYYESYGYEKKGDEIDFIGTVKNFVKMKYLSAKGEETTFYFKRSEITFD